MSALLPGREMDQAAMAQSLLRRLPGYTPEWSLAPGAKGYALLEVLAHYRALLDIGAAGLPERNLLALLDTLAIPLLPAQAARVPLVFQLTPNSPVDVTVAADSQLAAIPPPPPASPLATAPAANPAPVLFFTEQTVTLARAKLSALYSVDPGSDTYVDHSASLSSGFSVFGDMTGSEHAIYLGHDRLFKLGGREITLLLQCTLDAAPTKPLDIHWQYLSESGWLTLQKAEEEDTTRGLTRDGQIALRLDCGPDAKKEIFHGRATYWVRGTLNTPVIRGENMRHNPITINDLRIRVQFKKKNLLPEAAFADGTSLDVSKDYYPFGRQPATFNTFYLASAEVFQRAGARVHLDISLEPSGTPKASPAGGSFKLQWEYYGNGGWQKLGIEPDADGTAPYEFSLADQRITFNCPPDWQETLVNGVKNRWLRVRITGGSFSDLKNVKIGQETINNVTSDVTLPVVSNTVAPVVSVLMLSYTYLTDPETLDHCLTRNDFQFEDHTDDALWADRSFDPFWPVSDLGPALHFDFDQALPVGLVSLYVLVPGAQELAPGTASAFTWEYLSRSGWQQLGVLDETCGLRQSGMLQFIGPTDAVAAAGLGGTAYRIRARLKDGAKLTELPVSGIWLNSVWASHRVRIEQEPLGTADGTPAQALRFARAPVLEGETIEIREWSGSGEGWQIVARQVPEADLRYERDPITQKIKAAWVRWRERRQLYDAQPQDRFFVLERATGLIRFGNGTQGMIPPAGSRMVASYLTGGGLSGNVPINTVAQLRSAVPFVATVSNPVAAAGGADGETPVAISARGPQRLRHRNRAITASDIEWIARDASPAVARARCLAITGPVGHAQRGWITVIVIPHSADEQPQPSAELQRRVADYLRERVPSTVARRLQVVEPIYIAVKVVAKIVPRDPQQAAYVEARVRQRLNQYLHPLTGGSLGSGWDFGENLHLSNIATVIEAIDGVDYARDIHLYVEGGEHCQSIAVPRNALLSAGEHELQLVIEGR